MFRRALGRTIYRKLSTGASPTEEEIIRAFRCGNYENAIQLFARRPQSSRSDTLNETVIFACAQVPDAGAAAAVLHAMPKPTTAAVTSVISALCRERNAHAAVEILERVSSSGIILDDRLVAPVVRTAERFGPSDVFHRLKALDTVSSRQGGQLNVSGFFIEDRTDTSQWGAIGPEHKQQVTRKIIASERRLRAAKGQLTQVRAVWDELQLHPDIYAEVGVLAAALDAFTSCGSAGIGDAVRTLTSWVQTNMFSRTGAENPSRVVRNRSAVALLLTSTSKTLAAAAPVESELALSAFDLLDGLRIPAFIRSLPLAGAYFKVLQHANLSLSETEERIDRARAHHLQLDEKAFSMALGAILRCSARVVDKLEAARAWIGVMREAGIPLTVQTFNLYAGQLRYCNSPEMVTSLLTDMKNASVTPTAVTYGLLFSACVIPGEYTSSARKEALPVPLWRKLLAAMEEHMTVAGVEHSEYSLLSLARAYAHLGLPDEARQVFDAFVELQRAGTLEKEVYQRQMSIAYHQVIYNFAHCRECSSHGPEAALEFYDRMQAGNVDTSSSILDSVLVAAVRMGRAQTGMDAVQRHVGEQRSLKLGIFGLKHLLIALAELKSVRLWEATKLLILENKDLLSSRELVPTLEDLVISFARCQEREICQEIMAMARIDIPRLDSVLKGREFSRLRSRPSRSVSREENTQLTRGANGASDAHTVQKGTDVQARPFHNGRLLPLT